MTTSTPPPGPDDARNPQVAARLAVDPLDDVTRARLVRNALARSADAPVAPPTRRTRPAAALAIAAAVIALLVVAGAVLVPRGDDTTPTAVDAPAPTAAPEASRRAGDSGAAAAPTAEATPQESIPVPPLPALGDLGDVSTEAKLERSARGALAVPLGPPTAEIGGCAAAAARAFGTPVAVGTGRIGGKPAIVAVARQAAGSTAVVAVRGKSCDRAVSVILP